MTVPAAGLCPARSNDGTTFVGKPAKGGGWYCSLPAGHEGPHAAHMDHETYLPPIATWED